MKKNETCPHLGEYIGSAVALLDVPLYECKLKTATMQGVAGDGTKQFPFKKFCRVDGNLEEQEKCLEQKLI